MPTDSPTLGLKRKKPAVVYSRKKKAAKTNATSDHQKDPRPDDVEEQDSDDNEEERADVPGQVVYTPSLPFASCYVSTRSLLTISRSPDSTSEQRFRR